MKYENKEFFPLFGWVEKGNKSWKSKHRCAECGREAALLKPRVLCGPCFLETLRESE